MSAETPRASLSSIDLVNLRESRDGLLLRRVYDGLYAECFVAESEREPFAYYFDRLILDADEDADCRVDMLVARTAERQVAGFVIYEYYRQSGCVLVTYLAIAATQRSAGLARFLLDAAIERTAAQVPGVLAAVLLECHDPRRVAPAQDVLDPAARLRAMSRLGAAYLPIRYVQPALTADGQCSRDLVLLCLVRGDQLPVPRSETVERFIAGFYASAGVPDVAQDADFRRMQADLAALAAGRVAARHRRFAHQHGLRCVTGEDAV